MPSFTVFTLHTYLVMDASRKELKETQIFMHFDPSFARCVHVKADVCTTYIYKQKQKRTSWSTLGDPILRIGWERPYKKRHTWKFSKILETCSLVSKGGLFDDFVCFSHCGFLQRREQSLKQISPKKSAQTQFVIPGLIFTQTSARRVEQYNWKLSWKEIWWI